MKETTKPTAEKSGMLVSYGMYVLSMLIFGTNGLLVAHMSLQSGQIVLLRTLLGGLLLTVLVLLRGGFDRDALRAERVPLLLGGAALGLNWVALFEAYRLLNVSLATLIYYVGPMLILLLSPILFHEKLTSRKFTAIGLVAVFVVCPSLNIEAFAGLKVASATNGSPMLLFPLLFVTVACGACSGFHALVASGTTSKQISSEAHIRPIGYGCMLLEGVVALLALIAVAWHSQADLVAGLAQGKPVVLFAQGLASS